MDSPDLMFQFVRKWKNQRQKTNQQFVDCVKQVRVAHAPAPVPHGLQDESEERRKKTIESYLIYTEGKKNKSVVDALVSEFSGEPFNISELLA
eukprot:768464-Hanusia_phi.AAC.8